MAFLNKSDYLLSLELENKDIAARYKDKIRVIQCMDPFTFTSEETNTSIERFPPVTAFDIVTYLVLTHSFYTNKQMKAYKSLTGYKYFEAGFVHDCETREIEEHVVVLGKVRHSQRMNDPSLKVWVICEKDGGINSAHCTCMAGHSEVCSHVAAVLYALEYINQSAKNSSCTDVKAKWLVPSISNVPIIRLREMQLKKPVAEKLPTKTIPALDGLELVNFLQEIKNSDDDAVLMRVVEPFASDLSVDIQRSLLPTLYSIYKQEYEALTYTDLCALALQVRDEVNTELCQKILLATIDQNKSKEWFNQKAGRITASNFKRVCQTSVAKPSLSLVKSICYPLQFQFKSKATDWGLQHERRALEEFKIVHMKDHINVKVDRAGLYIDPNNSFLGASPDAMVSCNCCGSGCVEVKCPYVLKNINMGAYLDLKNSALTCDRDRAEVFLKRDHAYYYQTQMQIKVTGSRYCDFVIWSPKGFFHERIYPDIHFWVQHFPKLHQFHKKVLLPELLAKYFTKGKHLAQRWCFCSTIDDDKVMIQCENDSCEIQWFHLECVGLSVVPENLWICQTCSGS